MAVDEADCEGEINFDDESWKDVVPVYNSSIEDGVVQIAYSPRFRIVHAYLRALMTVNELSERAFDLTTEAIMLNPANYSTWRYRRALLKALKKDYKEEFAFTAQMIEDNPKTYQAWHHRRELVAQSRQSDDEHRFIALMLVDEPKNYHAWQYRYWFNNEFDAWSQLTPAVGTPSTCANELEYTAALIRNDIRNNSAWNHRYHAHVQLRTFANESKFNDELRFVLATINEAPNNESAWVYLRGILSLFHNDMSVIVSENNAVWRYCTLAREAKKQTVCMMRFMVDVLEACEEKSAEQNELQMELIDELAKTDQVRRNYWTYRRRKLQTKANMEGASK